MIEKHHRRYERAIKRQIERLETGSKQLPKMINALEDFINGKNVPRPIVERAMREIIALMTLPVVPYLTGVYTPKEFWKREPIARLVLECKAYLSIRSKKRR